MHSLTQATPLPRRLHVPVRSKGHLFWLGGAVLLVTLWTFRNQSITLPEFVCACVLLAISIQGYLSWSQARTTRIPVWALVCAAHFVFYGLAIFGALRKSPSAFDQGSDLRDSILTPAVVLAIGGLCS